MSRRGGGINAGPIAHDWMTDWGSTRRDPNRHMALRLEAQAILKRTTSPTDPLRAWAYGALDGVTAWGVVDLLAGRHTIREPDTGRPILAETLDVLLAVVRRIPPDLVERLHQAADRIRRPRPTAADVAESADAAAAAWATCKPQPQQHQQDDLLSQLEETSE